MTDPKRTLELLDRLEALGYDGTVHDILHHKVDDTIQAHRRYCRALVGGIRHDSNNDRFQRRLALVLGAYEGGRFEAGRRDVLFALARSARRLIPAHGDESAESHRSAAGIRDSASQHGSPSGQTGNHPTAHDVVDSGLYLVHPLNTEPISANAQDSRPAIRERSIHVNHDCCKVGRANRLTDRSRQYERTFGRGNVEFRPLAAVTDLRAAEQRVLKALGPYRIRGRTGTRNEWLTGIAPDAVEALVFECLEEAAIPYTDLRRQPWGEKSGDVPKA